MPDASHLGFVLGGAVGRDRGRMSAEWISEKAHSFDPIRLTDSARATIDLPFEADA